MHKWHKKWEKPRIFFIFSPKIENRFISELYRFIVGIKVVRNVILNNIDLNDQPSRMHSSSSRSRQTVSNSKKIQRKDKSDREKYFRFDHRVFWSKQMLSEIVFQTTYICMKNFLSCNVLPPGASKFSQTHKFDDFKSDTVISNNMVHCFSRNKSC